MIIIARMSRRKITHIFVVIQFRRHKSGLKICIHNKVKFKIVARLRVTTNMGNIDSNNIAKADADINLTAF